MGFLILLKFQEQQQGGVTDEAEPFMGSGRFGKLISLAFAAFLLGGVKISPFTCISLF